MTRPQLSLAERLLGVQHALVSGGAGKPHSIVNVHVRNLTPYPEGEIAVDFPEVFEQEPSMQTDSRPSAIRLKKFDTEPAMKVWAAAVNDLSDKRAVKLEDLWALISCDGVGSALQITTRLHNDMIAVRLQQKLRGSIRAYVRLTDLLRAVLDQDVPQFAVRSNMISYVSGGARNEFPWVENLTDNAVKPAAPPEHGYESVRWLGTAISEATKWCSDGPDQYGRQAIRIFPKDDATGTAEVVALRDMAGYRRLIKAPKLDNALVIVPTWVMKDEKLLGAHLAVRASGRDYAWLMTAGGIVLGIEMPELPWCTGYEDYFKGLDGRVEFTVDQVDAIRRALLQLEPLEYQDPAIGITATGTGVSLRGKNQSLEAEGMGDTSEEFFVHPTRLAEALRCRSIRFLEFDKEDPENYVRLTGPDVSVSIQPLTQPVR